MCILQVPGCVSHLRRWETNVTRWKLFLHARYEMCMLVRNGDVTLHNSAEKITGNQRTWRYISIILSYPQKHILWCWSQIHWKLFFLFISACTMWADLSRPLHQESRSSNSTSSNWQIMVIFDSMPTPLHFPIVFLVYPPCIWYLHLRFWA